jgi:tRNA A37 threonylcarbamoyladenosine modification protein TsaB
MLLVIGKIGRDALVRIFDKNFKVIAEKKQKDGNLLKMMESLFKKLKKTPKDLLSVAAINDSGTFSGVRSVVTVGNVLSYALKIPAISISIKDINDKKRLKTVLKNKSQIIMPKYGKEPNITVQKF